MSDDNGGLLPESHSFPVTTEDGHTVELGPLANALLTAGRNRMQDAEGESPLNPVTRLRKSP